MLSTVPVFHLQLLTTFYDWTEPFKQLDGDPWRKYATGQIKQLDGLGIIHASAGDLGR